MQFEDPEGAEYETSTIKEYIPVTWGLLEIKDTPLTVMDAAREIPDNNNTDKRNN
jgi:hypothetical protein